AVNFLCTSPIRVQNGPFGTVVRLQWSFGMPPLPSIFDQCKPRREVLAGQLPDSIFAADLWEVVLKKPETHPDYLDPARFFAGTHPTENLKLLVREVGERLAGVQEKSSVFRLETGF